MVVKLKSLGYQWYISEGFKRKKDALAFFAKHNKNDEDFRDVNHLMDWLHEQRRGPYQYSTHPRRQNPRGFIFDALD